MNRNIYYILLFSLIVSVSNAQIRTSVSNLLRYGKGIQSLGRISNDFNYTENLTDVRFKLPKNVNVGFRILYDDPPEVGKSFQGISRKFIEYKKNNLNLRVGNSSELYGRGLVLNLFENRGLAFDTWVDGLKASYKLDNLKASLIVGNIDFTDSINVYRTEKYKLRGGNLEYDLSNHFNFGLSFLSVESEIPQFDQSQLSINAELPELYFKFNLGEYDFFFNWANKWTESKTSNNNSNGDGIYSAFSYAGNSFGITVEYKNYKFDVQDPLVSDDITRTSKAMPFQNPPIVIKEHSYTLLSRALHEVNFNDEVGFQLDANYSLNDNFNINFNFSLSSKHDSFFYNLDNFTFDKKVRSNNYLPSNNDKYSPFTEIFTEAEYYINSLTAIRLGFAKRDKTIYNSFTGITGSHIIKSIVVPFQLQHTFSNNFSTIFQYEYEAVDDNFNTGQNKFNNQFISVLSSLFRKTTLSIRYEFTSNKNDNSGRTDWLLGEVGYRISGSNLITISYGRERGGQVCSNGICRYILPFKGFRFSLLTSL